MKKYIIAGLLAFSSQAALAQSWSGPGQQTVSYPGGASGSYTGVRGDGSNSHGGTPPAYATQPSDIDAATAGYTFADWSATTGISRIDASPNEEKVRFVCNSSHVAQEDPILFPGQSHEGHWHEFVGNTAAGKDSNYQQLRMNGGSTCPGGPINRTAYWKPALMKDLQSGISTIIRSDLEIFYYTHASGHGTRKVHLPNNFAFIGGKNPADPTNSVRLAEIPSGFVKASSGETGPQGDGFLGWVCALSNGTPVANVSGSSYYPALQTPEGNDPWQGNCVAGSTLYAEVAAPNCWDGKNSTSPDGRGHVRYMIRHGNSGVLVCPDGWYEVMQFIAKSQWTVGTGGWEDYRYWYLSSDRYGLTPANWQRPGYTFHFDWMNGWDPHAIKSWEAECGGVTNTGGGFTANPGECDSSTIGPALRLKVNEARPSCTGCASLSNDPIVNLGITYWNDGTARFYPVKPGMEGTTGHLSHGTAPSGISPPVSNQKYVVAEGDSISIYSALLYPHVYDQARTRVTVCGQAVGGSAMTNSGNPSLNVDDRMPNIFSGPCGDAVNGPHVVTLLIGANDLPLASTVGGPHPTLPQWFNYVWAYTDALRAQGIKVIMGTILPKGPACCSDYAEFNTARASANTTIRNAVGVHIDGVADFAANSTIGTDAAGADTSKYPDGLHPNSTVHATMATIYAAAVDAALNLPKE